MIFRFVSGSVTPSSRSRNIADASTDTSGSCSRSYRRTICSGLVLPQHAVVDEDARQPIADRAVHDERRHGRVDAPAQRAHHAAAADLRANLRGRLLHERRHRPVAGAAAHAEGEVPEDVQAVLGVHDLGMEQERVTAARRRRPSPPRARWRSSRGPRSPPAPRPRSRRGSPRPESPRARRRTTARARPPRPSRARTRAAPPAPRGRRASSP